MNNLRPPGEAVARLHAAEPRYEVYTIKANNVVEEAFGDLKIIEGVIYCNGGVAASGIPTGLNNALYIGRVKKYLSEYRQPGDESIPFVIPETRLSELQSARVYVYGDPGDQLVLIYR